jgi:hypothetical protein
MPTEIAKNEWSAIVGHVGLLELRWLPTTATMTDAGFMATLCLFAWEAERSRPRGLLSDMVQFRHKLGAGMLAWRDAHIVPRYGAAGVRKFAFLMPAGFPDAGKEAIDGSAVYPTRWFVERAEALSWLRAGWD